MNKREKSLFTMIVLMIVVLGAFWGIKTYMTHLSDKQAELARLESKAMLYRSSDAIAAQIKDEVEWLAANEPEPATYGEVQSELVKFLNDSGNTAGFTATNPKLIPLEDDGGKYRRVKVQITATAKEEQIYKWLVDIHQPTKFRAVTQILMKPSPQDEENIICTLTAEQWLIDAEQFTSEETEE